MNVTSEPQPPVRAQSLDPLLELAQTLRNLLDGPYAVVSVDDEVARDDIVSADNRRTRRMIGARVEPIVDAICIQIGLPASAHTKLTCTHRQHILFPRAEG